MALMTGDLSWYQIPEENLGIMVRGNFSMPDGNVTEAIPRSKRNEGCSIADWLMFNLNAALIKGDNDAYDRAERTFWNALAFNQILTGGFGHRGVTVNGYSSQQFSEAWWCCTQNAGMALAEYARHTVTYRNRKLHINFLTPGTFEVPIPNKRWVKVSIETEYPMTADARIEIEGLPADYRFEIRTPYWIRDSTIDRKQHGNRTSLHFKGSMAHRIETCHLGVIVTYGPLVLVPVEGGEAIDPPEENVPQGYIPGKLPLGVPNIVIEEGDMDAAGYVKLPRCPSDVPVPAWTYFDERIDSPTKVDGAPVMVKLKYVGGKSLDIRFVPMCYFTSNLTLFDTPVVFRGVEKV